MENNILEINQDLNTAKCPICQTKYSVGEINHCSVCNWDLTQCPEEFLERENIEQASERAFYKINIEIYNNPQLSFLKESNSDSLKLLINWICGVDIYAVLGAAIKLKEKYKGYKSNEIAHRIIVEKSFQAAGLSILKGIGATQLINALGDIDIPTIATLSAEMIYLIAAVYDLDLSSPERQIEVIAAFGLTFLGEQAIDAGIDWMKCGLMPGLVMSATAKSLMIYAVGNIAISLYEVNLNQMLEPLKTSDVFDEIKYKSQQYLVHALNEDKIENMISSEIKQAYTTYPKPILKPKIKSKTKDKSNNYEDKYSKLRSFLVSGNWQDADEETRRLLSIWSIIKIPCKVLKTIDYLWIKYSKGRFGFSVQKEIYDSSKSDYFTTYIDEPGWLGAMLGKKAKPIGHYTSKNDNFCQKLGWITNNYYMSFTFSRSAPRGHLPSFVKNTASSEEYETFFSKFGTCQSESKSYHRNYH